MQDYEQREREELAAANAATCPEARHVHQQLALHYRHIERLAFEFAPEPEPDTAKPHFVVLTHG
jgi:hypothetical protein